MSAGTRLAAGTALILVLSPPGGPWFGADKVKHFLMSALVHSAAHSVVRSAGMGRPGAQAAGMTAAMTVGFWKELHDRRSGKPFSVADLLWDAAGAASAAALLNRSR